MGLKVGRGGGKNSGEKGAQGQDRGFGQVDRCGCALDSEPLKYRDKVNESGAGGSSLVLGGAHI